MRRCAAIAAVVFLGAAPSALAGGHVELSGVVYTFNTPFPVAGARVAIAEYPELSTMTDAAGRYALSVPDEEEVTPFAEMPGYRTMHLQTFETEGESIQDAHFQLVPLQVYAFLAVLAGVDPASPLCQVVSTVAVKELRGLTFEELVQFGPQGLPGATVRSRPELPGPIYFNEQVMPDPSRTSTSIDGGVAFANVPDGRYRLIASHPAARFSKINVICAPGRFVNASPPWGLIEKRGSGNDQD